MSKEKQILVHCHNCASYYIFNIKGDMPDLVDCSWYLIDETTYIPDKTILADDKICPNCGICKD